MAIIPRGGGGDHPGKRQAGESQQQQQQQGERQQPVEGRQYFGGSPAAPSQADVML